MSDTEDVLPDKTVWWTGFPLVDTPQTFKVNAMLKQRCQLARLVAEMNDLIFHGQKHIGKSELYSSAKVLGRRIEYWLQSVPKELRYDKRAPTGLFDFYACCYYAQIALYDRAYQTLCEEPTVQDAASTETLENFKRDLHDSALQCAYKVATACRDYRETYGYKIILPWVMAQTWQAIFVLLRNMHLQADARDNNAQVGYNLDDQTELTESAFEECFRCLLASGLQLMLPRAIARMACLTAAQLKVRLPDAVEKILHLFKDDAWHPSDINQLSSAWPRWSPTNNETRQGDASDMEKLLWQWQALEVQEEASVRDSEAGATDAVDSAVPAIGPNTGL